MDDVPDHKKDILGYGRDTSRSWYHFIDHIRLYNLRDLTNQSDALKALGDVFASFSREQGLRQYWGIPIYPAAYRKIMIVRETKEKLYQALAFGLIWASKQAVREAHNIRPGEMAFRAGLEVGGYVLSNGLSEFLSSL